MADDLARKLNCINPDYKASVIAVHCNDNNSSIETVPINRTIAPLTTSQTDPNNLLNNYEYNKLIANHAVILMNIPSNNANLIVDPTNLIIGVYQNNKIKILNPIEKNSFSLSRNFLGDVFINGFDGFMYPVQYLDSYFDNCDLSFDELTNLYGIEAQNKAYDSIKNLDVEWDIKLAKRRNFKESLKTTGTEKLVEIQPVGTEKLVDFQPGGHKTYDTPVGTKKLGYYNPEEFPKQGDGKNGLMQHKGTQKRVDKNIKQQQAKNTYDYEKNEDR